MFYWLLKRIVLGPVLKTLFRPWVKGLENVPETGGAILASNHLSFSDSIFLPLMVRRRVTFLAKSDYFTGRGVKGRLTAGFLRGAGQLPIDRSGGRAGEAALRTGLRVLRRGDLLGIYPEGTRSPDGRLYRGKTGVARMALEGRVPVLPVVMVGTDRVQPIGRKIPHIRRVGLVIGAPLDFSRYEGMEGDRFVLRSITDEIMYDLMTLSGQEYADVYAASMKERLTAAAVRERFEALAARGRGRLHGEAAAAPASATNGAGSPTADAVTEDPVSEVEDAPAEVDAPVDDAHAGSSNGRAGDVPAPADVDRGDVENGDVDHGVDGGADRTRDDAPTA